MASENRRSVPVFNMTNFFNRELFIYSLGDIRFQKPVSLKRVAYTMGFLLVWTLPIVLIFGISFNIVFLAIAIGPPILLAHLSVTPVFGGKALVDFIVTTVKFAGEPKGWTDLNASPNLDKDVYYMESDIWISRRRELSMLADMREGKHNA